MGICADWRCYFFSTAPALSSTRTSTGIAASNALSDDTKFLELPEYPIQHRDLRSQYAEMQIDRDPADAQAILRVAGHAHCSGGTQWPGCRS